MSDIKPISVDGVTYWVTPLNPFEAIELDFLCARVGAGVVKAAVSSEDTKGFLKKLFASESGQSAVDSLLDSEILPVIIQALGDTFDEILSRVDHRDVVAAIRLAVIGHIECPHTHVDRLAIADEGTYFSVIEPRIRQFGDAHQLKLLWGVIQVNLGPTIAGVSTLLRPDTGERAG